MNNFIDYIFILAKKIDIDIFLYFNLGFELILCLLKLRMYIAKFTYFMLSLCEEVFGKTMYRPSI